jgi:ABC-2 type transport system permease protein
MPIFDQGYQHWDGHLSGHAWRWLTITRQGVRAQLKNRWARIVSLLALVPALVLAAFLILWGLIEQKASFITPFLSLLRELLPAGVTAEPKAYRSVIWTIAIQQFFAAQITFTMIIVLLVGPNLISQDLRFNAIPLYFSRPLRRIDYFVGKLGVIAFFLGLVAVVPVLLAYVLGLCFSLDISVAWDAIRVVAAGVVYGLIIVISAGMLMLAISSLSRNSRYVAVAWFGFWLVTNGAAGILVGTVRSDWCFLVSYTTNLQRVGGALLDTHSAWGKLAAPAASPRPGRPGRSGPPMEAHESRRPPHGPPGREHPLEADVEEPGSGQVLAAMAGPSYPWYWSAGVLAGLFGLSVWILTSRVKTLDRLK